MAAATAKARSGRLTQAEWNARAEQLAEARHTRGTARSLGPAGDVGYVWRVPSRSSLEEYHVVARRDGVVVCPCPQGTWGRPCSHAGAALHGERQRQDTSEPAVAWDWWMAGGEW